MAEAAVTSKVHTLADLLKVLNSPEGPTVSRDRTGSWEPPVHAHEWKSNRKSNCREAALLGTAVG